MANETIYGCVTWPGGVVTFFQDPDCYYSGCIEWTGVHAGQVAVTINTSACDDIYYGCVDWSTGKFEVSVPDDCCDQGMMCCPCDALEGFANCDGQYQPMHIRVNFSGVTPCSGEHECGVWLFHYTGNYTVSSILLECNKNSCSRSVCYYTKTKDISFTGDEERIGLYCPGNVLDWKYTTLTCTLDLYCSVPGALEAILNLWATDGVSDIECAFPDEDGCEICDYSYSLDPIHLFKAIFYADDFIVSSNCLISSVSKSNILTEDDCCVLEGGLWKGTGQAILSTPHGPGIVNPNICK